MVLGAAEPFAAPNGPEPKMATLGMGREAI